MTPDEQGRALRRAAARARCRVETLTERQTSAGPALAGHVVCPDGWAAARLLLAAALEDARTPGARVLALELRSLAPSDEAFARAVFDLVRARVRFVREAGEVFAAPWYTLEVGAGDCDDHARLAFALLVAGGVPARLAFLYRKRHANLGPSHVVAQVGLRGSWRWLETTVAAEFGEHPYDAARRLGLLSARQDIATEVRTMSEYDLPPIPPTFTGGDPATVERDAHALARLGYLCDVPDGVTARDPAFRRALLAFQLRHGLVPDALIGPVTRGALAQGLGALTSPRLSAHLSDAFFAGVREMAARMRAGGATIRAEHLLAVWLAESGVKNIRNGQGYPYGGLNQMGPNERRAAGWGGSFEEWLALDPAEQLPYVERFYRNATGGRFDVLRDEASLYLVNFMPAHSAHAGEPEFVLARRSPEDDGSAEWRNAHRGDVYAANRGLDTDGDGTIRVRELGAVVERAKRANAAYWAELTARLGEAPASRVASTAGRVAAVVGVLALMGAFTWWTVRT